MGRPRTPLSFEAQAARRPLPPEDLADARQERVGRDVGRVRPALTNRCLLPVPEALRRRLAAWGYEETGERDWRLWALLVMETACERHEEASDDE